LEESKEEKTMDETRNSFSAKAMSYYRALALKKVLIKAQVSKMTTWEYAVGISGTVGVPLPTGCRKLEVAYLLPPDYNVEPPELDYVMA